MGRRPHLADHGIKVRTGIEYISEREAELLKKKYSFRPGPKVDFHAALNEALSWAETFRNLAPRPVNESIDILCSANKSAKSLRKHLEKSSSKQLSAGILVDHPVTSRFLVRLQAACNARGTPSKRLRNDIEASSIRLHEALGKLGGKEIPTLFKHGREWVEGSTVDTSVDWLIEASDKAALQLQESSRLKESDSLPREKRKPEREDLKKLLVQLWRLFQLVADEKKDKIQWNRNQKRYIGTFFEFAKEVLPMANISISDTYLADTVKSSSLKPTNKR